MKKKARVKIKKAKIVKVVPIGPDTHLVVADAVEFEVHNPPPVPADKPHTYPLPVDPVEMEFTDYNAEADHPPETKSGVMGWTWAVLVIIGLVAVAWYLK